MKENVSISTNVDVCRSTNRIRFCFSGSFNAFEYGNSCLGYIDEVFGDFPGSDMWNPKTPLSEDCLNLNIWVPRPKREKRAVLVSYAIFFLILFMILTKKIITFCVLKSRFCLFLCKTFTGVDFWRRVLQWKQQSLGLQSKSLSCALRYYCCVHELQTFKLWIPHNRWQKNQRYVSTSC